MQFVFKRDEEGRERIYVGDVCVAQCLPLCTQHDGEYLPIQDVPGVDGDLIVDAIERADEAGFWKFDAKTEPAEVNHGLDYINNEVTVDVPVGDNAVLSVTVGGDES